MRIDDLALCQKQMNTEFMGLVYLLFTYSLKTYERLVFTAAIVVIVDAARKPSLLRQV